MRWSILGLFCLLLAVAYSQPQALVSFSVPPQALPGSTFKVEVTLSNPNSSAGYVPFVDIAIPQDVTYLSVTSKLNQPLSTTVTNLVSGACVAHPIEITEVEPDLVRKLVCTNANSLLRKVITIQYSITALSSATPVDILTFNLRLDLAASNRLGERLPIVTQGGFVLGGSAELYAEPSITNEDSGLLDVWTTQYIEPALVILKLEYSTSLVLWGPQSPVTVTATLSLAPGLVLYNCSVHLDVLNTFSMISQGTNTLPAAGWSTTAAPIYDLKPHNSQNYTFFASATSGSSGLFTYTFFVPEKDADDQFILSQIETWNRRTLPDIHLSLDGNRLDINGTAWPVTETTAATLTVANVDEVADLTVATDNPPAGGSSNDIFTHHSYIHTSAFHPPSLSYTLELKPGTVVNDTNHVMTLVVPGRVIGSGDSTVSVPVPLSALFINDTTATNGLTTARLNITTFLMDTFGASANFSGPISIDVQTFLKTNPAYASYGYLSSGDPLEITSSISTYGNVYDSVTGIYRLPFNPFTARISHIDGEPIITPSPPPLFTLKDLVTFHVSLTPQGSWKNLTWEMYLPYPLLDATDLVFNTTFLANDTNLPANSTLALVAGYNGIEPEVSFSKGHIAINFFSYDGPSVIEFYFTLQVGKTILYPNRSPIAHLWNAKQNAIEFEGMIDALVGSPILIPASATAYLQSDSGYLTGGACPYCYSANPAPGACSSYTPSAAQRSQFISLADQLQTIKTRTLFPAIATNIQAGDEVVNFIIVQNFGSSSAANVFLRDKLPTGFQEPPTGFDFCFHSLDGAVIPHNGTSLFDSVGISFPFISVAAPTFNTDVIMLTYRLAVAPNVSMATNLTTAGAICQYDGELLIHCTEDSFLTVTASPAIHNFTLSSNISLADNLIQIGQVFELEAVLSLPGGNYSELVTNITFTGTSLVNVTSAVVESAGTITNGLLGTGDSGSYTGSQIQFYFGNVTVGPSFPFSRPVLRMVMVIPDDPANAQSDTLDVKLTAGMTNYNMVSNATTTQYSLTIAEPVGAIVSHSFNSTSGDAGNVVRALGSFRFNTPAPGLTESYKVRINVQTVDTTLNYQLSSLLIGSLPFTVISQSARGFEVELDDPVVSGSNLPFNWTGIVDANALVSQTFVVTTNISWSSVPYLGGRFGSLQYTDSYTITSPTSALALISSTVDQSLANNFVIGERATYQLNLTLPEGVTTLHSVNFTLPESASVERLLVYSSFVSSIDAAITGLPWALGSNATIYGNVVSWNLANPVNATNTANSASTAGAVIAFQVIVTVKDVSVNTNGATASITTSAKTGHFAPLSLSGTTPFTIREPSYTLTSVITRVNCSLPGGFQGGCLVYSSIEIRPTGLPYVGFRARIVANMTQLNELITSTPTVTVTPVSAEQPAITYIDDASLVLDVSVLNATTLVNVSFVTVVSAELLPGSLIGWTTNLTFYSSVDTNNSRLHKVDSSLVNPTYTPIPFFNTSLTGLGYPVGDITYVPPGEIVVMNLSIPFSSNRNHPLVKITLPPALSFYDHPIYQKAAVYHLGDSLNLTAAINYAVGTSANFSAPDANGHVSSADFDFGLLRGIGPDMDHQDQITIMLSVRVNASLVSAGQNHFVSATVWVVEPTDLLRSALSTRVVQNQLTIIEPTPITTAATQDVPGDGSDIKSVALTFTAAQLRANYYDMNLTIALDAQSPLRTGSFVITASSGQSTAYTLITSSPTGAVLNIPSLSAPTSWIRVYFEVILDNYVVPGQILNGNASMTYYSTNYSHTDIATSKQYNAALQAFGWSVTTLPPSDALSINATNVNNVAVVPAYSTVSIGTTVIWQQRIQIIEGNSSVILRFKQNPVTYARLQIITANVALGPRMTSTVDVNDSAQRSLVDNDADSVDDQINLNLGTITNLADNDPTNDYLLVNITALTRDVLPGSYGPISMLSTMIKGGYTTTNTSSLTVAEPTLQATVVTASSFVDAGDFYNWTITLKHATASVTNAFNVTVTLDTLSAYLAIDTGVNWSSTVAPSSPPTFTTSNFVIPFDVYQRSGPATITITVPVRVQQSVHPNSDLNGVVRLAWYSTPLPANAHLYTNNITTTVFKALTTPTPAPYASIVAKSTTPGNTNTLNIGETVIFNATTSIIEGTLTFATIRINFPNNYFDIVWAEVIFVGANIQSGPTLGASPTSTGSSFATWTFSNLVNIWDNVASNSDKIIVQAQLRLKDVPAIVRGTTLAMSAQFSSEASTTTTISRSPSFVVAEPDYTLSVTQNVSTIDGGTGILTNIFLTSTGNSMAYNVSVQIALPSTIGYVLGSVTLVSAPMGTTISSVNVIDATHLNVTFDQLGTVNVQFSLVTTVLQNVHPASTYVAVYSVSYKTHPNSPTSRTKSPSPAQTSTFNSIALPIGAGASAASIAYTGVEYAHYAARTLNIGERATFCGQVGLVQATFDYVDLNVTMPTLSGTPIMSIEQLNISYIGPQIIGESSLVVGAAPTSWSYDSSGRAVFASFRFNNVVNLIDGRDTGNDTIAYCGTARVLNIPTLTIPFSALTIMGVTKPEATAGILTRTDSYSLADGTLSMSVSSHPAYAQAGDSVYSTALVSPSGTDYGTVYNLTVTFSSDSPLVDPRVFYTSVPYANMFVVNQTAITVVFDQVLHTASPINITILSNVSVGQHPTATYYTRISGIYNSSKTPIESRARTLTGTTQLNIFASPQGPSVPNFFFLESELASDRTIRVGEGVYFESHVALLYATFDTVKLNVSMPWNNGGQLLMDIEDAWVEFIGPYISSTDPNLALLARPTASNYSGSYRSFVEFSFSNVVSNDNPAPTNTSDLIIIRGFARVLNVSSTVQGTVLTASSKIAPQGSSASFTSSLNVVESAITMTSSTSPSSSLEAGDSIVTSLKVSHLASSHASAYNITITLTYPGSVDLDQPLAIVPAVPAEFTIVNNHTLHIFIPVLQNPGYTWLNVSATLNVGVRPITHYDVVANLTWSSVPHVSQARWKGVNAVSGFTTIAGPIGLSQPSFEFVNRTYAHVNDVAGINIGETVTFEANVALIQATFDSITVVVEMPLTVTSGAAMTIESIGVVSFGSQIEGLDLFIGRQPNSTVAVGNYITQATFVFTDVKNRPDGQDLGTDLITIVGVARVINDTHNVRGTVLSAEATISPQGSTGSYPDALTVVEGVLALSVSTNQTLGQAGDVYQLDVNIHTLPISNAEVFNITVTITHPPELSFVLPLVFSSNASFIVMSESADELVVQLYHFDKNYQYAVNFSVACVVNTIVHPTLTYTTYYHVDYNSSFIDHNREARLRSLNTDTHFTIQSGPVYLAKPSFHLGPLPYSHPNNHTVNIGELVPFTARTALIFATFTTVQVKVDMPLAPGGNALWSIESIFVESFRSSISGPDLAVNANATSTVDVSGYTTSATFLFNNVVNLPHLLETDDDVITIVGFARVLNNVQNDRKDVLVANLTVQPEGSSASFAASLVVVEGELLVSESSSPVMTEGGHEYETVLTFDRSLVSNGTVFNLTILVSHPVELEVLRPPYVVSSTYPAELVSNLNDLTLEIMIGEVPYDMSTFSVTFRSNVTSRVHPGFRYTSIIGIAYYSAHDNDHHQARERILNTTSSIDILTDADAVPTFALVETTQDHQSNTSQIQIGEDMTFSYRIYLRSFTLDYLNISFTTGTQAGLSITSATVHNWTSSVVQPSLAVGQSAVISREPFAGVDFGAKANFNLSHVVTEFDGAPCYIEFQIIAKVVNASHLVQNVPVWIVADSAAENLTSTTRKITAYIVEPIIKTTLQFISSDAQKLEPLFTPTVGALTVEHDSTSLGFAWNMTVVLRVPAALNLLPSSVSLNAPYNAVYSPETSTVEEFKFFINEFSLTSTPMVFTFEFQAMNASEMPGNVHLIHAFVDYFSEPYAGEHRRYAGLLGRDFDAPTVPATVEPVEIGFPTMGVAYATEYSFNNNVVVVGEKIVLTVTLQMPSGTSNLKYHMSSEHDSIIIDSMAVQSIGNRLGGVNPSISTVFGTAEDADVTTFDFSSQVVTDNRNDLAGQLAGTRDQIVLSLHFHVNNDLRNADGSIFTFTSLLTFDGGPTQRSTNYSYVLRQPTLDLLATEPMPPEMINLPTFNETELNVTSPSEVEFDAGDIVAGTATVKHFPGATIKAENATIVLSIDPNMEFVSLVFNNTGTIVDFSNPTSWNEIVDGATQFPPPNGVKRLQLYIGTFLVGNITEISYQLRVLPTVQPGNNLSLSIQLTWSSYDDWAIGRSQSTLQPWTLRTSSTLIPPTSTYGKDVSLLISGGSLTGRTPLLGPGANETLVGDVVVFRSVVYLPEGTYKQFKILAEVDEHMKLMPLLQNGDYVPGGTFVDFPLPYTSSITDFRPLFLQANLQDHTLEIDLPTDLLLSNSTDEHFVPLIIYVAASVINEPSVQRNLIISAPKLTLSWALGQIELVGERSVVIEPSFVFGLASTSRLIYPSQFFTMSYTFQHDHLSNSPSFQHSFTLNLNTSFLKFLRSGVTVSSTDSKRADETSLNVTKTFINDQTVKIDVPYIPQNHGPIHISYPIFANPSVPLGTHFAPRMDMSYSSQPADHVPGPMFGTGRSFSSVSLLGMKYDSAPVVNTSLLHYTIMEHTELLLNAHTIYNDTDGTLVNATLLILNPGNSGETTANTSTAEILYHPDYYYNGEDMFEIRICDEFLVCTSATIYVTIIPVVDVPYANEDVARTAPMQGVDKCGYPACTGVYIMPLFNDWSPDARNDVVLDVNRFTILKKPTLGEVSYEIVNSSDMEGMIEHQNLSIKLLYTSTYIARDEVVDEVPYQICDTQGVCNSTVMKFVIPGSSLRTADARVLPGNTETCWPSYVFMILSWAFGIRGPTSVNLVEHMLDYEQFIAYSQYMTGSGLKPPQKYRDFSSCYAWTIINLPDYLKLYKHQTDDPSLTMSQLMMKFFLNHVIWLFIGLGISLVYGFVVLVPISFLLWDRIFKKDAERISVTGEEWSTVHRLLYGLSPIFRYGIMVTLPIVFWAFYVERFAASVHLIILGIPLILFGLAFIMWFLKNDILFFSLNKWHAWLFELYNDYKEERMWWILVFLGKSAAIGLVVGLVNTKLTSVWIVFAIKLVYAVAAGILRPHSCYFSLFMDIFQNGASVIGCILFYLVAEDKIASNALIIFHYVIMIIIIVGCLGSTGYHLYRYFKGPKKEESPKESPKEKSEE